MIRGSIASTTLMLGYLCLAQVAGAGQLVSIDLSPLPNGTVLNDQFRDIGVLFGARRSDEPILEDSPTVDPVAQFAGHLFFDPDLFGNVAILHFVTPGTNEPALVQYFSGITDSGFGVFANENIVLWAYNAAGEVVGSDAFPGSNGPRSLIKMDLTTQPGVYFSALEIRTFGDPGIAIDDLSFVRVPEPSTLLLMTVGTLALAVAWRRRV